MIRRRVILCSGQAMRQGPLPSPSPGLLKVAHFLARRFARKTGLRDGERSGLAGASTSSFWRLFCHLRGLLPLASGTDVHRDPCLRLDKHAERRCRGSDVFGSDICTCRLRIGHQIILNSSVLLWMPSRWPTGPTPLIRKRIVSWDRSRISGGSGATVFGGFWECWGPGRN